MGLGQKPKVLLVEDSPSLALVYQEYLRNEPWHVSHCDTGQDALTFINATPPDVILLDLELPDINGMEILKHVYQSHLPSAVVIITAHGSVDIAVEAMRYRALDFVEKPFDAKRLIVTLRNALEHQKLSRIVEIYRENFDREQYHGFIGASLAMQGVYRIIDNAAPSTATVFITGESGTGKELCAEAIHKQSPRREKPFIPLNCAAIPKDLMESEIFGHVKGAFTGAVKEREGAASRANGGTLFLDEIGDMDLELQSKLLRFVQTGVLQKVGSNTQEKVDVRFVCATNHDPLQDVQAGRFREDLYYRLNVIPIHLPPLREREGDILLIAQRFLLTYSKEENKSFTHFDTEVEELFSHYEWPGNVRQLQNVIRNIVVLNEAEKVSIDMLPPPLNTLPFTPVASTMTAKTAPNTPIKNNVPQNSDIFTPTNVIRPLWLVEKETIENAIKACDGNIPRAAALLEVSPSTIYRKRQSWQENEQEIEPV